ncbi:MAG: hypothetical protein ACSHXH_18885 [Marivita sp.]
MLIHLIAGLADTDKTTAVVIFLTLNTTRARVDLVERLAKMDRIPVEQRSRILALTARMMKISPLRNRYSHSIYAFDPKSGSARTIMMRIADRKDDLKMGRNDTINDASLDEISNAISELKNINGAFWSLSVEFGYPI